MNLMSRKKRIRWIRNNFCINFGIVPEEAVVVPVYIYIYINIQKVLYKSKFDALSIRTRSIALKRTRSFTNISLGESSPNSAFVPLYKKKKRRRTSLQTLSTTQLREIKISIKRRKDLWFWKNISKSKLNSLSLSPTSRNQTNFNLIESWNEFVNIFRNSRRL